MKVLILMAAYNGEKYLEEQICSLLKQKEVEVQILVRDDGSSDGTVEILQKYQSEGILKWYTGERLNVQWGFYDLMEKASEYEYDYIAFCDQDDVWDDDKLKIAVERLEVFEERIPSLYYCGQRLVNAELQLLEEHQLSRDRSHKARFLLSDIAGCTAVFNKALLQEVISYRPEYMLMHDTWVLKVCLALGGNVVVDSDVHMNYRQHGNNTVGLGSGWRAKLDRMKKYIFEYRVEEQMDELLKGYGAKIVPEYMEIVNYVRTYKKSWKSRRKLLDRDVIDYKNMGINVTYFIKIMINRL